MSYADEALRGLPYKYPNFLIGLSGVAGSGKSYIAEILEQRHGFRRVRFADPLKDMLRVILRTGGTSRYVEECIEGGLKELPCPELQMRSPREAMQTLGTEWGRNCISPHLWTDIAIRRVRQHREYNRAVVIDDVRFDNEVSAIRQLGGFIARIDGAHSRTSSNHVSEAPPQGPDIIIDNRARSPRRAEDAADFIVNSLMDRMK